MDLQLKAHAHQNTTPWGNVLTTSSLVVSLHTMTDNPEDATVLFNLYTTLNNEDAQWKRCWYAAEEHTDGTLHIDEKACITARYLMHTKTYPKFKSALKALKARFDAA